jgi:hypothetical protein
MKSIVKTSLSATAAAIAISVCVVLAGLTTPISAQSTSLNGSFEVGSFTPDTTWAGGQAVTLGSHGSGTGALFPNLPFDPWVGGWAPSNLNGAYWINSSAAYDGTKYLYLSGSDACFNLLYGTGYGVYSYYQALTPGLTYNYSFRVASAQDLSGGATPASQLFRVEWSDGGNPSVVTNYNLAPNPAWSDTALTTIPWQLITYTFTPTSATGVLTFSTNPSTASAIVLDGPGIAPVPEPGGALLVGITGGLLLFRRRRLAGA